jgi:hypothetical protein
MRCELGLRNHTDAQPPDNRLTQPLAAFDLERRRDADASIRGGLIECGLGRRTGFAHDHRFAMQIGHRDCFAPGQRMGPIEHDQNAMLVVEYRMHGFACAIAPDDADIRAKLVQVFNHLVNDCQAHGALDPGAVVTKRRQ